MGSSGVGKYTIANSYGFGGKGKTGKGFDQYGFQAGRPVMYSNAGVKYDAFQGMNPLFNQLMNSGLYEAGGINPSLLGGRGGRTQAFGALTKAQDAGFASAADFMVNQGLANTFGPQAIETAGKLSAKELETLSQLPQYKEFFQNQTAALQGAGNFLLAAQQGLQGFDQGGFGQVSPGVDQALGNFYAQGISRFGLEGSPLGANQAGTAYAATKAQLGEQIRGSRFAQYGQALGSLNQTLGGFSIPGQGSLLGGIPNTGFGYGSLQGQEAQKMQDKMYKQSVQQGYGSLVGAGLGAATGLWGSSMIAGAMKPMAKA